MSDQQNLFMTLHELIDPANHHFSRAPWSACRNGECTCGQIWGGDEYPIAEVQSGEWGDSYPALRPLKTDHLGGGVEPYIETIPYGMGATPEETTANARLIAAAPDLLQALVALMEKVNPFQQASFGFLTPQFVQGVTAIRKALEGEPSTKTVEEHLTVEDNR